MISAFFKAALFYIALAYGVAFLYIFYQNWRIKATKAWFTKHNKALRQGEKVKFRGRLIDQDSPMIQYLCAISFVFAAGKFPTAYAHPNSFYNFVQRWLAVVFSLIFGWWGIFRGPIYTVQCLHLNIKQQGHLCNIGGVLSEIEAEYSSTQERS